MVNLWAVGSRSLALLIFLFSFIIPGASPALAGEVPQVEWERTFGGDESDFGYYVSQTSDGLPASHLLRPTKVMFTC